MRRHLSQVATLEALQFDYTTLEDCLCLSKAVRNLSALTTLRLATSKVVTKELVEPLGSLRGLRALELSLLDVSCPSHRQTFTLKTVSQ